MDGSAGDEGPLVVVAVPHLDPEGDLPRRGLLEPQAAFGAVAFGELPGALEQDAVPAEVADDRLDLLALVPDRENEVLPARVGNGMPLLFSIVGLHRIVERGGPGRPDAYRRPHPGQCAGRAGSLPLSFDSFYHESRTAVTAICSAVPETIGKGNSDITRRGAASVERFTGSLVHGSHAAY